MGKISSINIQPVKSTSEQHNKREQELDYVKKEKTYLNYSWEEDSIANVLANVKIAVKEKTGRSMQKKATPIREGVFNFKESHADQEIITAIRSIEKKFGIKPFQIHLHRDEGHTDVDGTWKPNLHGHVIFNWTNMDTGKSFKLDKAKMSELQTYLANALSMERGVSSDKNHLNTLAYKIQAEGKKLEHLIDSVQHQESLYESLFQESLDLETDIEYLNFDVNELNQTMTEKEIQIMQLEVDWEHNKKLLQEQLDKQKHLQKQLKELMKKVEYFNPKNLPSRLANELKAINASRSKNPDFDQQIKRAGYTLSQKNKPDENNNQTRGRKM